MVLSKVGTLAQVYQLLLAPEVRRLLVLRHFRHLGPILICVHRLVLCK